MKKIPYSMSRSIVRGYVDTVYVNESDDLREEVVQSVVGNISLNIDVTVGGVTIHLAAWMDPDDWQEDWAKALGEQTFEEYLAGL